jgi:hypothetical protein
VNRTACGVQGEGNNEGGNAVPHFAVAGWPVRQLASVSGFLAPVLTPSTWVTRIATDGMRSERIGPSRDQSVAHRGPASTPRSLFSDRNGPGMLLAHGKVPGHGEHPALSVVPALSSPTAVGRSVRSDVVRPDPRPLVDGTRTRARMADPDMHCRPCRMTLRTCRIVGDADHMLPAYRREQVGRA